MYKGRQYDHEFYHRDGKTDLSVMKQEALRYQRMNASAVIHYHDKEWACDGIMHDVFDVAIEGEVVDAGSGPPA